MKNKIEDFVDLSNRIIPQSVRTMIESLPIEGKEALVAFLDSNSDFSQHASFEVVSKQFLMDVSDSANRSVFHYTSLESLKKILDSRAFLIKEKDYMNDPEEFSYTCSLAVNELEKIGANHQEILAFKKCIGSNPFNDVYIWSFTKNGESQALFGNYSGKSNNGVSLKFDAKEIQIQLSSHFSHGKNKPNDFAKGDAYVFPVNIVYDQSLQLSFIQPITQEWLKSFRSRSSDPTDMQKIILQCVKMLVFLGMCFKNPLLYQEEEVRFLIINIGSGKQYQPELEINRVPFVKCELLPTNLKAVVVQTGSEIDQKELTALLENYGFSDTESVKSMLPY